MLYFIAHEWRVHSDFATQDSIWLLLPILIPRCLLFGVWGIMALELDVFVRNCCVFFFFIMPKDAFFSSWNRKRLDSVCDEQILTKRFWNPGKHINPTDLPYFLPLSSWLLFLWFFTFCSGLQFRATVSSACLFWVGVKGLPPPLLACFSFLCLDSYVCTF